MELSIVIEKMMILVLIMLVGFIARKAKLTDDEANRYFSRLLINVFLVCSILRSTVNVDPVLSGREMLLLFGLFALGFGIYWLMDHPLCKICGRPATEVDHIIPHKGNQILFWNKANWQSLCHSCHSKKTIRENGYYHD